jgi:hypothetical protein
MDTLTARFIEAMDEEAAALGVREAPTYEPRATEIYSTDAGNQSACTSRRGARL